MKKYSLGALSFTVALVLALSQPAKADATDPFFNEVVGNSCPTNCASSVLGTDPMSGTLTVEYIFNSTIPNVVAGDVNRHTPDSRLVGRDFSPLGVPLQPNSD